MGQSLSVGLPAPSFRLQNHVHAKCLAWLAAAVALIFSGEIPSGALADEPRAIEWLNGPSQPVRMSPAQLRDTVAQLAGGASQHVLVQFDSPVSPALKGRLEADGLKLLTYVSSDAFFAIVGGAANAASLSATPSLVRILLVAREWKLHPLLNAGEVPLWAVVQPADPQKGETSPIVGAYVLFHPDVALATEGVNLALRHNATVRSKLETVNGLVIELPFADIPALADEDGVQWIEPPLPRMEEFNNSNRAITGANIVQAPPYGLNGSGVKVLVYDGGIGLASHQDFGGRLTTRDSSPLSNHATHVAGTVGGSGAASGGNFKGMAPAVTIESYGFQSDGSGIFLYSNPGDIQNDYNQAINTFGADISNNSIGTNTCNNGFPCTITGDYGVTSALIDSIVGGSLGAPFRVVWANGNERGCPGGCQGQHQNGYHSTAPPACAKNHLTVGALNSNNDSQTSFSSWGPCDDGRLKPDVAGPGCQSNDDGGVTSCSSSGGYTLFCGTSMSSPTVCGLSALLLQDYRVQFPGEPDFRNSTLRMFMAHTAQDLGNAGPDYQFGYGSVRIQPAVDFMRTGNFLEDSVAQGGTYSVLVVVSPGDPTLKVTMAWDDPAAAPNVNPSLVNDLDLVVFDPSQVQQFPWTLNPASPANPAVRTQADHVNNIEQVFVANPTPGAWRVEVRGFNVPMGPQTFSLCASPVLVNCSTQGVNSLDRVKYACESEATVQVVDCDLNTNDAMIETVTVTVFSDTEPAGESVILTETAPESAAFRGTVTLSAADASGVLHVADGDTVTARYIDADDGFGGTNVVVDDTALVDCQPPVISNVQAINVGPVTATVTFTTDEQAQGTVRYGTSCGALNSTATGSGFNTAHSIALTGLTENSTFFYAVDAEDQAGNDASDDNGGSCYSFVTPDIPNYFTEQFTGDHDLDHTTLTFSPDGSFDFYSECAESITSLPVDPAGGTVLTFPAPGDDAAATINLSGGATVSLYGVSYGTVFVGTNGYVTFGASDTDWDETLALHFDSPRVAALFDDLHPGQGGSVSWKQLPDRFVVTWQNVPEYNAGNSNTLQIDLGFDGTIRVSALAVAAGDGITGLSAGDGLPSPFFETDLSASGACGPRPPTAANGSATTPVATSVAISLGGSDDGLPLPPAALDYIVSSLPAHGSLTDPGSGAIASVPYTLADGLNQVSYLPQPLYQGPDNFQFKVNDGGIAPEGGDSNTATVSIAVGGPVAVFTFPFDSDPEWFMQGQWQYGPPTGGGSHGLDPSSGHTGSNVLGYNLAGDYANSLSVQYLTTPALNCTNLDQTQLRFWRWLGVDASSLDHANIQVSSNGTTWTTVWDHSGAAINDSAWTQHVFDISAVADGKPAVYLRWGMGPTNGSVTYPGWNLDDIEIWAVLPVADCNANLVFDPVDIFGGGSDDCNLNVVPDECETGLGPGIASHPNNVTVCEGAPANFNVSASGSGLLKYQWQKNLADISSATSATYSINPVLTSDTGSYRVVVDDACNSLNSNPATLTVLTNAACDDSNPCTSDICNGLAGCVHSNVSGACSDGDQCTINDVCAFGSCFGTQIVRYFGDVAPANGNGQVDIDDLLCALLGFAFFGDCVNADLIPCGGNGLIDVDDVLAMLDAFSGINACPHPCPP